MRGKKENEYVDLNEYVDVIIQKEEKLKKPKRKRGMKDILAKMTSEEYETYLVQPAASDKPLKCGKCSLSFPNNVELGFHSIKHNDKGLYECHVCVEYAHQNKQAFDIHIREHEGIKKYKCPICNKQFTTIRPAYEHQYFHGKEKPFTCDICGQKFRTSVAARNHKTEVHYEMLTGQKFEKFDCKICNKHYANRSGLDHHNFRHHKELCKQMPALCDICGKDFSTKAQLRNHKRTHSKESAYSCDVCSKKFTQLAGLKQHQSVHTGEKKYACSYCGKRFAYFSGYNYHLKLHTGEKPFSCIICGKKYIAPGNLRIHMANHHSSQVLKS
ncbi:oocyte zinc finger protein XlCOF19-like [Diabrotica virgifera virgifera]|uniref:C2H2-type domain-containing protein n=1 Tax=Diabrotica virgifera virgifera TaxID=50390 RepID=A0ABM5L330_DIAVI|nr:oocyte zinc finger protein XlCOF19-like [Diabrotica virgifera virgifera]